VAAARREKRSLAAVVLAAGKGERLRSDTPKVLHSVAGRPLVWHTLQAIRAAKPDRIVVVVGHGADDVRGAVASIGIEPAPVFVEQDEQLGTGHAVQLAEKAVGRTDDVLVANGDFDPITPADVRKLISSHRRSDAAVTVGSTILERPGGYGRVVREASRVVDVVEGRDASTSIRKIHEVATNWIAFRRDLLYATLPLLDRDNRQREYYLNRAISILLEKGERVDAVACDTGGLLGANTRAGLASLEALIRRRVLDEHMAKGVGVIDPATTYVDVEVAIGRDTVLRPNTYLEAGTRIGAACDIGPSARIVRSHVGDRSTVSFAVVEDSRIGRDCEVGPFARIRAGAVLEDTAEVGNFVEVKKSRVGKGSKAKHLAYLGDADLGARVNVGAGTVTVNYDGYEKHRTVVGDEARIGSDTMLVAPIEVGKGAVTGAGSVITKDVPAGALAVERTDQKNVAGYRRRADTKHGSKGQH
jgi:bifunctional UDP-N-acetylglucosamine pyrophosphorylase/glucosamine-1-phosphate N-acetyltransferase